MSGFSADWLALRAVADAAARAESLTARLAAHCRDRGRVAVLDLGCGTGANLCFLAPRLGVPQVWTLVDNDSALLDRAAAAPLPGLELTLKTRCLDLAGGLESLDLSGCDLVTASALMDLVSAAWFDRLAVLCRAAGCLLFPVLTYDGVMEWSPEDPFDATVRTLFNRHQRSDKGFGPALGPAAPEHMEKGLRGLGFRAETARSDWLLGAEETALQGALLEGFAGAALELEPGREPEIRDWAARRRRLLEDPAARLRVGHLDLLASP